MDKQDIIKEHFSKLGKKGGKNRAAKYDPEQLKKWGAMGGRPKGKKLDNQVK